MEYNRLKVIDNDDNTIIKINDNDITAGITKYSLERTGKNMNLIKLSLEMILTPEEIKIKKNSKSSNN